MCLQAGLAFPNGGRAADLLAAEMENSLGVKVDVETLRRWVETRWSVISPLSHTIHAAHAMAEAMVASAKEACTEHQRT